MEDEVRLLDTAGPVLNAERVSKSYLDGSERVWACRDVSLKVQPGEFVLVRGPSGSGKSTLLMSCAGLVPIDSGAISISGLPLAGSDAERRRVRLLSVGVVFQDYLLIEEFTAAENVMLPLESGGAQGSDARREAQSWLELVGLAGEASRRPNELSGGQRQRVAIARALAGKKQLIIADEPTGSLDSRNSADVFQLLRRLADSGVAVVVASHDPQCSDVSDIVHDMRDGVLSGCD